MKSIFVGSNPKCYTPRPNEVGRVEFFKSEPTDQQKDYEVELRRYLSLKIKCNNNAKIAIYRNGIDSNPEIEDNSGVWTGF